MTCGIFVLLLAGCIDKAAQVADLNREVLEIHDTAMVKMDAIYDRISALRKLEKEFAPTDSTAGNPAAQGEVLDAIAQLQRADDAMMDWMRDYHPPVEEDPADSSLAYLEAQKISIVQVDEQIDESLAHGKEILNKHE